MVIVDAACCCFQIASEGNVLGFFKYTISIWFNLCGKLILSLLQKEKDNSVDDFF